MSEAFASKFDENLRKYIAKGKDIIYISKSQPALKQKKKLNFLKFGNYEFKKVSCDEA